MHNNGDEPNIEIFDKKQRLLFYNKFFEMVPNKGVFYSKKGFTFLNS